MKNFRFIFYILIFCISDLIAQDSISLKDRIKNNIYDNADLVDYSEFNPALKKYSRFSNLTNFKIGAYNKTGNAGYIQEGLNTQVFYLDLNSFRNYEKHSVWGNANYSYAIKNNMRWNESSDFNKVYPYVIADSVLANKLISERYSFSGGYAGMIDKNTSYGFNFEYTALMVYRTRDPRPNNMSSDLKISTGISYALTTRYVLGLGLGFEKYRQKSKLEFFNFIGHPPVLHFQGMGIYSPLFSLEKWSETSFDANTFFVSLQLVPVKKNGLIVNLSAKQSNLEKTVIQNGNVFVPISYLKENNIMLDVSYLSSIDNQTIMLGVLSKLDNKTGNENLFDGNLKIISKRMGIYTNYSLTSNASILYRNDLSKKFSFQIKPFCEYYLYDETYGFPFRNMKVSILNIGLGNGVFYLINNNLLSLNLNLSCPKKLKSNLVINGDSQNGIMELLEGNYNNLIATGLRTKINLRWDCVYSERLSCYINLNWQNLNYSRNRLFSNFYNISLGVNL